MEQEILPIIVLSIVIPFNIREIFCWRALLTALEGIGFSVGWSYFEKKCVWHTAVWISVPTCFCTGYAFIHLSGCPL